MAILSVQSHVAYGHVGNRAAVFPLERLGFEVIQVNTVHFSNHPGYGFWKGEVSPGSLIAAILDELAERGLLDEVSAVLSGYLGAEESGEALLDLVEGLKGRRPGIVYCCDPVMGDVGSGVYVRRGIPELFRGRALGLADIIKPNAFEAELLSGHPLGSLSEAEKACAVLHELGPRIILVTSFSPREAKKGTRSLLLSVDGELGLISTPELRMDPEPHGSGDLLSALFLGRYLLCRDPFRAAEDAVNSLYAILERTKAAGSRELRIVEAQEEIEKPRSLFGLERPGSRAYTKKS